MTKDERASGSNKVHDIGIPDGHIPLVIPKKEIVKPKILTLTPQSSQNLTGRVASGESKKLQTPKGWKDYLEDMRTSIGDAVEERAKGNLYEAGQASRKVLHAYDFLSGIYTRNCQGQELPAEVYYLKGQAEFILNKGDCVNSFEQALKVDPNHTNTLYALSMVLAFTDVKTPETVDRAYALIGQAKTLVPDDQKIDHLSQKIGELIAARESA